jgi:dTDP-4-dehydrorhamnose 3,5-epimerase
MKILDTHIKGLVFLESKVFNDERGFFTELFNQEIQELLGNNVNFVQDNLSISKKNVVRGLHFQIPPFAQGKLVRAIKGEILDIAVDLRKDSPTFGQYESFVLNDQNHRCLYIPEGFAHGFASLKEDSVLFYKCTNVYHKISDRVLLWNDSSLNINWNVDNPIISEKDKFGLTIDNFTQIFPNL